MQEFIFCIVPIVFQISFNAELPLAMNILHSLLEDFLWHYYYSKAYSSMFKFLEHAWQFRNSAVKLSASVIFKKSLAKLKGPGFELDNSEVPNFYRFSFSPCLTLNTFESFFMQIPSLVQEVFECYLTSYPLSNSIYQSFKA